MHRPRGPALTVSVVVPARDDARELARCLRALARQTRAPLEVIVVDNGSADATASVAAAAGARVVRQPDRGVAAAAALGYDSALGDVIARLDADCLPSRFWLARGARYLEARPSAAAITGFARFLTPSRALGVVGGLAYLAAYFAFAGAAIAAVPLFGSNAFIRREAWEAVSGTVHRHDPDVHDDLDLSLHLAPHRRLRLVPGLAMAMSPRALTGGGWHARGERAMHTLRLHWPAEAPWRRWRARLLHRAPDAGSVHPIP